MKIEDVLTSLTIIKTTLEEIPIIHEDEGLASAMFTLGSITSALQNLIDVILLNDIKGIEEAEK